MPPVAPALEGEFFTTSAAWEAQGIPSLTELIRCTERSNLASGITERNVFGDRVVNNNSMVQA